MATTKKRLISFRSNTTFKLNYETNLLTPETELVLLSVEPKYEVNKKGEIMKGSELNEFRIFCSLEGINTMIGDLQLLATQLQTFEQLSTGVNTLIENSKSKSNPKT